MRFILPLAITGLLLSGCTSYQYTALKSDLQKSEESDRYFYSDTNSTISFDFYGYNFPVHILIENTGDKDLFVDLDRTLFLKNNEILSNAIPNSSTKISASLTAMGSEITYPGDYSTVITSGSVNGTATTKHYSVMLYIPKGKKKNLTYHPFTVPYDKKIKKNSHLETRISEDGYQVAKMLILPENERPQYAIRFYIIPEKPDAVGYPVECMFYPNLVLTTAVSPKKFELATPEVFYIEK